MHSDPVTIGTAARLAGCAPSALRYYERRGLVRPTQDSSGRRRYDHEQLRRIAFIRFGQRLDMSLERIAALLDGTGGTWRSLVDQQVAALDAQIARAEAARRVLAEARDCPSPRPLADCPYLHHLLDKALEGTR